MLSDISLQLVSILYVVVLATVYFVKRRYNFLESKIYKVLLGVTFFNLLLNIVNIFIDNTNIFIDNTNILFVISILYCLGLFFWLILFISYLLLSMSNKKYENFKLLIRDHPVIYSIIIAIIIIFLVLVLSQNLFGLKFVNYYNKDINIIYAFGIISSLIIMFVLLINNKKIANYKNWSILVSTILLVLMLFIQIFYPDISIIGSGLSLITLFQYFTMENPDLKYIDELNALKIKAEQANAAKTNFLASMSHEIRTPMNAIIGLSESMLNSNIPDEFKEDVKNINEAGSILLEIVNNILDITKVEEGKTTLNNKPYSLADTIAKLSHMVEISLIDKPIKFNVQVVGNIPNTLMGDEVKIYQILMNILSNAVKYTKKGSITFVIESVLFGNKDTLTFKVIDTGIGIKKADNAKLFQKFERLDQEQSDIQGTGLGLTITKKLLDLMGGKISFESVYQQGTTFTIVVEQEIVDKSSVNFETYKAKKMTVDSYFDGSKYNILLVDDNLLNLKVAEKMLKQYNLNVTSVKSGLECLNKTKNNKYDLIFMDHMMPEMDGIHTLYNLKNRASGFDTPVVVLTANAIDGSMEMYLREGFCDYLSKPIDQVELDRILREQLKIDSNGSSSNNVNTPNSINNDVINNPM
jgi:signal transduction histidine kinase/CheY-like chemotaxis protein